MIPCSRLASLLHCDALLLGRELLRDVQTSYEAKQVLGRLPHLLILTASKRQVAKVRQRLVESTQGLLGVEVLTHLGFARKVLEALGEPPPAIIPQPLREAVVEELCRRRPGNNLAAWAGAHPGVAGTLASLFNELREAGVKANDLTRLADTDSTKDLAALYTLYESALEHLAKDGRVDRAAFVRRAAAALKDAPPWDAVFQIGAYDLVGMNLDLVRALAERSPVTLLVPADPEAPAYTFARKFLDKHVAAPITALKNESPRPFVQAARAYRDPDAHPEPLPEGALRFLTAQGPEAELTVAVREALRLHREGTPLDRIAVVARSLEPYAAIAPSVFERHGLPVDTSLRLPLARRPRARAFHLLLKTLAGDFERRDVIDLARSPHLRAPQSDDGARWTPDLWDRLARRYRLVRGATEWTRALPEAVDAEEPPEDLRDDPDAAARFAEERAGRAVSVRRLAGAVATWAAEAAQWNSLASAREHAAFLAKLGATWIDGWGAGDREDDALQGLLADLESLEAGARAAAAAAGAAGATAKLSPADVLAYLARALNETALNESVPGGLAVLDVMQARGLVFDHVIFIGFNADLVPRRPREDPFLPDRLRRRLADELGVPLAVRLDAMDEEILLIASVLTSVERSLTVTWQRADSEGRAVPYSLQLRELIRFLPGSWTLGEFFAEAPRKLVGGRPLLDRAPAHPRDLALWSASRFGFVPREEAALPVAAAARRNAAGAVERFLHVLDPSVAARLGGQLKLVSSVDDLDGRDLAWDGVPGAGHRFERRFSASSLERLARCPQTFFFQDVLGVRPLDEAAEETRLDVLELGGVIHSVLEKVFTALRDRAAGGDLRALAGEAEALLAEHLGRYLGAAGRRVRTAFPVLWASVERAWTDELREYLDVELKRLGAAGASVEALEAAWEADIELAPPKGSGYPAFTLPVQGRVDRATRGGDGALTVSDYKTGHGKLAEWLGGSKILPGDKLQLPLYVLLARARGEADARAELIGLGPGFRPEHSFLRGGAPPTVTMADIEKLGAGLDETLAVLHRMAVEGLFPFRSDTHCDWCAFRPACRRHHHASRVRQEEAAAFRDYFDVKKKRSRKPLLADVRAAGGSDEGDEA